jgi:ABC-type antimicrobial peptide transport system permease subunit
VFYELVLKSNTALRQEVMAMPLMYPVKHVFRNWKIFAALLIGVALAATFCAGIGVKANLSAEQALDQQIKSVIADLSFQADLNQTNLALALKNITDTPGVTEVEAYASFYNQMWSSADNYSRSEFPRLVSFPSSSKFYDQWTNKPLDGIPANYTYIVAGSDLAKRLHVGDNITTMINFPTPKYYNTSTVYVNFTVAGYAEITDEGYNLLSGGGGIIYAVDRTNFASSSSSLISSLPYGGTGYRSNMMIISWENTLKPLWNSTLDSSTATMNFIINLDRENLISPWNIPTSVTKINQIASNIQNQIMANYLAYPTYVNNMLGNTLSNYQSNFDSMIWSFAIVSIPIFIVAWYLGMTVSDVSFNIRRREIGLLSTKGLSSGQIQRMFLTEAVIIGLVGGGLGVVGGLILNQYYLGTVDLTSMFSRQLFSPEIAVVTIAFGVILSLISVFWSSRKAARMPAVEALRDYTAIGNKSRFRFIPWIALILGGYKIVLQAFGLNIMDMAYQWLYTSGSSFGIYAVQALGFFDGIMTIFGPFLFFWGITIIIIRDSSKFQTLATKIASVMGDLGALAAKNVRRNPGRLAAMACIIAFIIGFSVQVTGQAASQQDYIVRNVHNSVGADISVSMVNASHAQAVLNDILGNITGIQNATIQRTLNPRLADSYNSMTVQAIDPDSWIKSAYFEPEWFSGASIEQMMTDLKNSNNTIILDKSVAKALGKNLYDMVGVDFDSCARNLRIVGFYGRDPPDTSSSQPVTYYGGVESKPFINAMYQSYVPANLFNMTEYSDIYQLESFTTTYLITLKPGVNGTEVAKQIRALDPTEISYVTSFDEQWRLTEELNNSAVYSTQQTLDIQGLGLIFAVISASAGTALIALVSLKERSREATLMSVRGLSFRQLVWMFLTESMAIITFAVILGLVIGVIIVFGTVNSTNTSLYQYSLVGLRLIFPTNAVATIGSYIALIYASTIGAIIVMSSQYVTKLEKMVRTR